MSQVCLSGGTLITAVPGADPFVADLLFEDGLIQGVYPADTFKGIEATDVEVLDVAGMTVLPGLIDLHVHLFLSGDADSVSNPDFSISKAAERARQHLAAGVTTVRDVAAPTPEIYRLRDDIASGRLTGARIVTSGPIITSRGGHASWIGREVDTREELLSLIRELHRDGVDCIKLAVSGKLDGVQFSEDDVRAAVQLSHELGLHVASHAVNPESVRVSALAGVDTVEHGSILDDEAIEALVTSSSILVPTSAVADRVLHFLSDSSIPEEDRQGWLHGPNGIDEGDVTVLHDHFKFISRAISAGAAVAVGSDAGGPFAGHGLAALETRLLVDCGLDSQAAIEAATRVPAEVMRMGDRLGTLEAGKVADVLVVAGDPLQELDSLEAVRIVIKDGAVVHRAATE